MTKRVFPCVERIVLISLLAITGCFATSEGDPFQGDGLSFTHDDMEAVSQKAPEGCLEASADTVLESDVPCIAVVADGITIDLNGFTVNGNIVRQRGGGRENVEVRNGTVAGGAIYLGGTLLDQVTVRDSNATFAVQVGTGSLIKDSLFERNRVAVDLYWGDGVEVRGCRFVANRTGVNIAGDNDSRIIDNDFEENRTGIGIWDENRRGSSNSEIRQNRFIRNDVGVSLYAQDEANGTQISRNLFQSNSSSGIAVSLGCATYNSSDCGGRGTVIKRNRFIRNGDEPTTGSVYLELPDRSREPYELVLDDGLTVIGIEDLNTADGVTLIGNTGIRNADLAFDAPGVIDGGTNLARQNGNPLECVGVACRHR